VATEAGPTDAQGRHGSPKVRVRPSSTPCPAIILDYDNFASRITGGAFTTVWPSRGPMEHADKHFLPESVEFFTWVANSQWTVKGRIAPCDIGLPLTERGLSKTRATLSASRNP